MFFGECARATAATGLEAEVYVLPYLSATANLGTFTADFDFAPSVTYQKAGLGVDFFALDAQSGFDSEDSSFLISAPSISLNTDIDISVAIDLFAEACLGGCFLDVTEPLIDINLRLPFLEVDTLTQTGRILSPPTDPVALLEVLVDYIENPPTSFDDAANRGLYTDLGNTLAALEGSAGGGWEAYKQDLENSSDVDKNKRDNYPDTGDYHAVTSSVSSLDPALIVYTSGSSGKPKGAVLSHHGLCFGATVQAQHFSVQEPSIICNMPINHVACIADICCTTLVKGGTICFQSSFDPQSMLEALEKEKIKIWAGVPTMFLLQLEQANFISYDLTKLQLILWGGAAMPESAINQLRTLGVPMMTLYGMTETSAHTIYSDKRASLWSLRDNIGRPDIRMPCRIVNELSIECPVGVQGELQFRGDYLMLGYYNNPNATRAAYTDDGWFRSGDIGLWLDSGEISLVGRISDMYKSGGYNIYPREIELLLESHPSVGASVVVSIPDPIFQEVSIASIFIKRSQLILDNDLQPS